MSKRRPDGTGQLISGVIIAIAGAGTFVSGMLTHVSRYPTVDFEALAFRSQLLFGGGAMLSIALLLLAVGWILKAISFLPGRDDVIRTTGHPTLDLAAAQALPEEQAPPDSMTTILMVIGGALLFVVLVIAAASNLG